jgi:hypothetical protein
MRRVHRDAYSTIIGLVILAGAITLILALANPVR